MGKISYFDGYQKNLVTKDLHLFVTFMLQNWSRPLKGPKKNWEKKIKKEEPMNKFIFIIKDS